MDTSTVHFKFCIKTYPATEKAIKDSERDYCYLLLISSFEFTFNFKTYLKFAIKYYVII